MVEICFNKYSVYVVYFFRFDQDFAFSITFNIMVYFILKLYDSNKWRWACFGYHGFPFV